MLCSSMSDTWPCSGPCSQKRAGQAETVTIFIIADEAGKRLFHILNDLDAPVGDGLPLATNSALLPALNRILARLQAQ